MAESEFVHVQGTLKVVMPDPATLFHRLQHCGITYEQLCSYVSQIAEAYRPPVQLSPIELATHILLAIGHTESQLSTSRTLQTFRLHREQLAIQAIDALVFTDQSPVAAHIQWFRDQTLVAFRTQSAR